uniref:SJCHGC03711 protein n=1 Tax=Schistosoma japonicum TaxID=6182 RepID=Q5DGT7_SCHJA|nr:SJCHGC03711 protein [Schistosoma japonicum]
MELTTWPNRLNRMLNIDSKVKAALTRTYNKSSHLLPYVTSSASSFKRKRGSAVGGTTVSLEGVENDDSGLFEDEEEQDDMVDLKNDAMILVRKEEPKKSVSIGKPKSQVEHTSASSDNNNKGRGRGRGRGRVKD